MSLSLLLGCSLRVSSLPRAHREHRSEKPTANPQVLHPTHQATVCRLLVQDAPPPPI